MRDEEGRNSRRWNKETTKEKKWEYEEGEVIKQIFLDLLHLYKLSKIKY